MLSAPISEFLAGVITMGAMAKRLASVLAAGAGVGAMVEVALLLVRVPVPDWVDRYFAQGLLITLVVAFVGGIAGLSVRHRRGVVVGGMAFAAVALVLVVPQLNPGRDFGRICARLGDAAGTREWVFPANVSLRDDPDHTGGEGWERVDLWRNEATCTASNGRAVRVSQASLLAYLRG